MGRIRLSVCRPAFFVGQPRVEKPSKVTFPLPEGFNAGQGQRLLVRCASEAACKAARACTSRYPQRSLQLLCADWDATP